MPVPHDKTPNMIASYRLEAVSIAVNLAEMKYVLLNDKRAGTLYFPFETLL